MDHPDVLAWRDGHIEALDQTALPHQVRTLRIGTVDELVRAITSLAIRGAPVLGAAGALGVALAVRQGASYVVAAPPAGHKAAEGGSGSPLELLHVEGNYAVYRVRDPGAAAIKAPTPPRPQVRTAAAASAGTG